MAFRTSLLFAAAALTLAGCEARFGNDAAPSNGSAEGKAEDGRLTISTNGFEMKVNIPEGIRRESDFDDDSGIIYPGSRMSGVHIEGDRGAEGRGSGEVELRFTTADAPDLVERWYRDPARAADFTTSRAGREGNAFVVAGTRKPDNGAFQVWLTPRNGGGTDGRAVLTDSNEGSDP